MNPKIKKLIEKLQSKLVDYQEKLEKVQREISDLKNNPPTGQNNFLEKEQELEQVRVQLLNITTERDNVREQIGQKIDELNASNLSKEEKTEQISSLMTGEYQKLKGACQKLTQTWKD